MTIHKITVTREAIDYYTVSDQELLSTRRGTRWQDVQGWGGRVCRDLPEFIRRRDPRTELRRDGSSYTFFALECAFPWAPYIGKGWINSQGEEVPDRFFVPPLYK